MMKIELLLTALILALFSCGGSEDKDLQKPEIQIVQPQNCTELRRGESFTFTAHFADNAELGSYNLEIHHNFDHHSHSTDSEDCTPSPAVIAPLPTGYEALAVSCTASGYCRACSHAK
ncbi:MAG: DUF4625 domain-containing protein [Tannerella sp.]|nr:DUF4625 domain-containing protein [Tannerella sp.]